MYKVPEIDKAGLRKFGLMMGFMFITIFGLLYPLLQDSTFMWWPWLIGGILLVWAILAPSSLNLVYIIWMRIGLVLGYVNTRIILLIIYYLVFMPVGFVMRLMGNDPMARKIDYGIKTYRLESNSVTNKKMEVPF